MLLDSGAEADAETDKGVTPLVAAARNGRAEVVRILLDAGADPDKMDADGHSALYWADLDGHDEVVALLRERLAEGGGGEPQP